MEQDTERKGEGKVVLSDRRLTKDTPTARTTASGGRLRGRSGWRWQFRTAPVDSSTRKAQRGGGDVDGIRIWERGVRAAAAGIGSHCLGVGCLQSGSITIGVGKKEEGGGLYTPPL
jgi:hypothetical protein